LEDILLSDVKPTAGRNIFFHEIGCHSPDARNTVNLTARQACAIESAALHNPNFQVFVLFASATYLQGDTDLKNPITDALLSYGNVRFRQLNLWRYAESTPIEDWLKSGQLFQSSYLVKHTFELLRLLSLYRFGGIFLRLDAMVLRSLEILPLNYVGADTEESVSNSVISLHADGFGHWLGELFLREFQQNYNGNRWSHDAPHYLESVLSAVCGTKDIRLMLENPDRCHGFRVFSANAFYEINWLEWFLLFEPKLQRETLERVQDSYVIHLWNHLNTDVPFEPEAAYMQLAAKHCPKVFAAAGRLF
ncbi:hypothetical protein KR222_000555, partial [Zaprionus bogoriensis]